MRMQRSLQIEILWLLLNSLVTAAKVLAVKLNRSKHEGDHCYEVTLNGWSFLTRPATEGDQCLLLMILQVSSPSLYFPSRDALHSVQSFHVILMTRALPLKLNFNQLLLSGATPAATAAGHPFIIGSL